MKVQHVIYSSTGVFVLDCAHQPSEFVTEKSKLTLQWDESSHYANHCSHYMDTFCKQLRK
jgi:hypothetical protein